MKLSAVIMAHPSREEEAEELQASLDRPVPIQYDPNPIPSSDPIQRWKNGRASWEAADPEADWHMVIQDDAVASKDLLAGLEEALDMVGPDGLVSAYTGTGRPNQQHVRRALRHAKDKDHSWMSTRSLCWGVAILAPVYTIPGMLEWCEEAGRSGKVNYDKLLGTYYRDVMQWRTWYTVPSLVDHRDGESLVGHGGTKRVAHKLAEGSALDIDWTRTPPGGLKIQIG